MIENKGRDRHLDRIIENKSGEGHLDRIIENKSRALRAFALVYSAFFFLLHIKNKRKSCTKYNNLLIKLA
jgi:hypothetical protein